jgi:hypothetical protein
MVHKFSLTQDTKFQEHPQHDFAGGVPETLPLTTKHLKFHFLSITINIFLTKFEQLIENRRISRQVA